MLPLLRDPDAEIRAAAARLMGTGCLIAAQGQLEDLFKDKSPRVRMQAILAYRDLFAGFHRGGHRYTTTFLDSLKQRANRIVGTRFGVPGPSLRWPTTSLSEVLAGDSHSEPYVQHAATQLLTEIARNSGTAFTPNMKKFAGTFSPIVRRSLLLSYRRMEDPAVSTFLADSDLGLVLEAARAINDVPIEAAYPALAGLIDPDGISRLVGHGAKSEIDNSELAFFTLRRVLNANFRLGQPANALALARFAARDNSPEPLRIEALELLSQWPEPPARDHIMGLYRPLPPRDGQPAINALRPVASGLLTNAPAEVRLAAIKAVAALGMKEVDLYALVADRQQSAEVRIEALTFLARLNDWRYVSALNLALKDSSEPLRLAAAKLPGTRFDVQLFKTAFESGSVAEKQGALASLATAPGETVDNLLGEQLDAFLAGTLPNELQLDVLEAAAGRPGLKPKLEALAARSPKGDALAPYRSTLHGGNAENGRKLFIENQQLACFRCHKVNGEGGDVGPDVTGLGEKKGREYLLEAIVLPNKEVAAGFESVVIDMKDGASYAGLVKSETDTELVLNSPEDGVMTLKKSEINSRQRGLSAMPEELANFMSRRELRDIIEFLATLK
jgi:quinoprotein glucose dehydrogenase